MVNKVEYIAEIGINHNGNIDLAKEHIKSAKNAGATVAKFQTYITETRVAKSSKIFDILKKCELSHQDFVELKRFCEDENIKFASTPFCKESADWLIEMDTAIIKIASFHLTNTELLKHIYKNFFKEIIVSTGVSSMEEIKQANNLFESSGRPKGMLKFMHCISEYPVINKKDMHLSNINTIGDITGKPVGLSDHSIGPDIPMFAIFCGAKIIEKHFTIDNLLEGADHSMSADPTIFREMVQKCNSALEILGNTRGDNYYLNEKAISEFRVNTN